jgi:hypothetical protein
VGEQLVSSQGLLVPIESISNLNEITTVYNLRVADHHTYFVGGALWGWDVWVHNASYVKRVLEESEQLGGHALAKHLAKSNGYLKKRVHAGETNLATTFRSRDEMEAAVGELLANAGGRIKNWAANPQLSPPKQMEVVVKLSKKMGRGVSKRGNNFETIDGLTHVRAFIQRDGESTRGFRIVTVFPSQG